MAENDEANSGFFAELSKWMSLAMECNQALVEDALEQIQKPHLQTDIMFNGLSSFVKSVLNSDPQCLYRLMEHQLELMGDQLSLLDSMLDRMSGKKADPVIHPAIDDRRFMDDEWSDNPFFDFIKQSYLINNRALEKMVESMALTEGDKEKVGFYLRQLSSALAPTNFPLSNPEIVRQIRESQGASLIKGVKQLIEDRKKSGDFLNVCMSDHTSFVVGENIARTPGKVVFENELMQLIQYTPVREQVFSIPLLFIPSWINKYYVYDLRHSNSMVQWALDNGLTVFMISWVNPDTSHRHLGFDEYIETGLLKALQKVKRIAGVESVNCAGYCLGGALLAGAVAYLAKIQDHSIHSATYLATSFDFTDPGEFRVLLDDHLVGGVVHTLKEIGYYDGRELAVSFSILRENELYWNYYIQNYLKGERPNGFDILHWNSDSTNVTEKMHTFVMRDLVKGNLFVQAEGFSVLGEPVVLSNSSQPVYILATEKDHIAKWKSCYAGIRLHGGHSRFVLAGSGHIAGVINPASKNKYHYYTNTRFTDDPEEWLDGAFKHEGSWWRDWYGWLSLNSGERRAALSVANKDVIEDAPGRYVKRRLDTDNSSTSHRAVKNSQAA